MQIDTRTNPPLGIQELPPVGCPDQMFQHQHQYTPIKTLGRMELQGHLCLVRTHFPDAVLPKHIESSLELSELLRTSTVTDADLFWERRSESDARQLDPDLLHFERRL